MSYHHWDECRNEDKQCHNERETLCFPDSTMVTYERGTCENFNKTNYNSVRSGYDVKYGSFLQEVEDSLLRKLEHLANQVNDVDCKVETLLTNSLATQAQIYPAEVLSDILKTPVYAVKLGDIFGTFSCAKTNATLMDTLRLNSSLVSARPLVQFVDAARKTHIGQIFPNDIIQVGTKYVEPTGRKMSNSRTRYFKINGVIYKFYNDSLTEVDVKVDRITPSFHDVSVDLEDNHDYEAILAAHFERDDDSMGTDLSSLASDASSRQASHARAIVTLAQSLTHSDIPSHTENPDDAMSHITGWFEGTFLSVLGWISAPLGKTLSGIIMAAMIGAAVYFGGKRAMLCVRQRKQRVQRRTGPVRRNGRNRGSNYRQEDDRVVGRMFNRQFPSPRMQQRARRRSGVDPQDPGYIIVLPPAPPLSLRQQRQLRSRNPPPQPSPRVQRNAGPAPVQGNVPHGDAGGDNE